MTPGLDLINYSSFRLNYQRKAKGNSLVMSLYRFNQAEPAYIDMASIANVKVELDSSGLQKFIYLGDFIQVHRIKLQESN